MRGDVPNARRLFYDPYTMTSSTLFISVAVRRLMQARPMIAFGEEQPVA